MDESFKELTGMLEQRKQLYAQAKEKEEKARANLTHALNELNEAQKMFDEYVDEIRKQAPQETDWAKKEAKK